MDDQDAVFARFKIEHYRAMLVTLPEGSKRKMLLQQLSEEEAKLASLVPEHDRQSESKGAATRR